MLRVLPPLLKPVNNLICCKTDLMWLHVFCCPFFRTLSHAFAFSDLDECTSSPPVCDLNADCTNTRGSYLCTCKAGFSGDGKTCSRKDKFLLSFLSKIWGPGWGAGGGIAIFVYFSQIIKLVAKSNDYINSYNKF